MAVSGKAIKTRIKSVKNTKKMTKAMEMVSAAKMRKSVSAALSAREYALLARELMQYLTQAQIARVPLFETREVKNLLCVLITSNRGLCGSFNANIFKKSSQILSQKDLLGIQKTVQGKDVKASDDFSIDILGIGKKSALFARKAELPLVQVFDDLTEKPSFEDTLPISKILLEYFKKKQYDKIVVVYTKFESPLVQEVKVRQLLPVSAHDLEKVLSDMKQTKLLETKKTDLESYVFEPNQKQILNEILPRLVEIQLFESILESAASEHSARMMAMKNASSSASDMIDMLTLEYNKARQAAITQEISEIVGGAAAQES